MKRQQMWLVIVLGSMLMANGPAAFAGDRAADIERISEAARGESQVMDHLNYLSNRIGPRLTSSDGLQTACEWAVERFKSFGIENAHLEKWGEFPVGFNRGPWSGRIVEPAENARSLEFGTNSWTAGTKGLTRGPALLAPENDEQLEAVKSKLAGAWILTTEAPPRPNAAPNQAGGDFRSKRTAAYNEAGIAGIVRPTRNELIVTGGSFQVAWDKLPTLPVINMVKKDWDAVSALIKDGKPVMLEFDVRNYFKKGPIPLYNVIADIPGTEKPDEYVIFGGHIDSWDGATGTTDNGTGCATTLEAARILMKSGVKPKRTIRFMLWSGEEQGLLGSRAYVKAHPELMPKISAVLVHDGGTNYLSGINHTEAMTSDMQQAFAAVLAIDHPEMKFTLRKTPGLFGGGSDHASFLGAGVPGFFWGQAGKARYVETHHTQFDTYDRAIPQYQQHSSHVIALAAYGIADLDRLLPREGLTARGGAGGPFGGFGGRRLLGVGLDELTINEVMDGGVAAKAGLKTGDVIVKLGDKAVKDGEELRELMRATPPPKTITVKRDGKEVEKALEWPATPAQPARPNQ